MEDERSPAGPAERGRHLIRSKPIARGSRPRKQRKGSRAATAREADKICGELVRARGRCEDCGSTEFLQWAHGFSRRYRGTRWDLRNSFCLCRGCHYRFTLRPLEWDEWLRNRWGQDQYDLLRRQALHGGKVDVKLILVALKAA